MSQDRSTENALFFIACVFGASCAPTLSITRPTAPEGTLGNIRSLSVTVHTNMGEAVAQSIAGGLLAGEIPIPVAVNETVRTEFESRLARLGYQVCQGTPCGDGAMTVMMEQSEVNSRLTDRGAVAHVRLRARVRVKQNDQFEPYDWSFWDQRNGSVAAAPRLVEACASHLGARFESTLLPGQVTHHLPLVDNKVLSVGVNHLLARNWNAAIAFFTKLVEEQPDNDGAWYDLGVAWEAYGDAKNAATSYERAAGLKRSRMYLDALNEARANVPPSQQ